ncbi:MAG TPA: O-antigen ligase family protein [bacterium]|jgi:O-antigen ligase|nr:O-antigen ligase family protein [bacterium]HOG37854.1 O-antigen ligase family protein [bacterium]
MFNFLKNKYFSITFLSLIVLDAIFFLAHKFTTFNYIAFSLLAICIIYLISYDIKWIIYISFLELFVGSFGRLMSIDLFGFSLSLRIFIFVISFIFGMIYVVKNKKIDFLKSQYKCFYFVYILILIFGIIIALINKAKISNIFFDINNFIFFLILPIYYQIIIKEERILKNLFYIFISATLFLSLKTIIVFYLFSQHFSCLDFTSLYKWIRDSRLGEITKMNEHFYRIFFQSQIYLMIAFIINSVILIFQKLKKKEKIFFYILLIINLSAIIISFSRSFWLGIVSSLLILFIILILKKEKFINIVTNYLKLFGILILSVFFVFILLKIPDTHINFADMLSGRVSESDASSNSRMELLNPMLRDIKKSPILGHGFAHEISYFSKDPRNLNDSNPTGEVTTYSFEWGWLSFWLKIGIFGLLFYIILSLKIIKDSVKLIGSNNVIFIASLLCFISISVVHIFSPYLDHPLGLGFIILIICIIEKYKNDSLSFPRS